MKQLLIEDATTEDFVRVKETFEKCILALLPDKVDRFVYIREENFEGLTTHIKKTTLSRCTAGNAKLEAYGS